MGTCLACNKRTPKPRQVAGHELCATCHKGAQEVHGGDDAAMAQEVLDLAQRKAAANAVGTSWRDRRS